MLFDWLDAGRAAGDDVLGGVLRREFAWREADGSFADDDRDHGRAGRGLPRYARQWGVPWAP